MATSTADFRNGMCFKFNNDLFQLIEFQHVKPGKGPAFVRTKIKSLTTGRVLDNTFTAGVKIDDVRIERRQYQFFYKCIGYCFVRYYFENYFLILMFNSPPRVPVGKNHT